MVYGKPYGGLQIQVKVEQPVVCVVGLGYVGLPLAKAFSWHLRVIGFDTDNNRVKELNHDNGNQNLIISDDPQLMREADFIMITVPTPITKSKEPDLSYVTSAARMVSQNMKTGCTVILESTVYPGVMEDIVKPILEEYGLQCGKDFRIGYSPERINPGDEEHTIEKVAKVVSGMDDETTELIAQLYSKICPQVFKAKDIKTAEAAKVIENIQRDLNIALVNELSLIFERMGLSTRDVLNAAATKWNFYRCSPGLVGGHCIPVYPYFLINDGKLETDLTKAARKVNDSMADFFFNKIMKLNPKRVCILGLTFRDGVKETAYTRSKPLIDLLKKNGVEVFGLDKLLNEREIKDEFGVDECASIDNMDCVVIVNKDEYYKEIVKPVMGKIPIIDCRNLLS